MRTHTKHKNEKCKYCNRITDDHFKIIHDRIFNFLHISRDTGHDIALLMLVIERKRKYQNLSVDSVADIVYSPDPHIGHIKHSKIAGNIAQKKGNDDYSTNEYKCLNLTFINNDTANQVVHISEKRFGTERPFRTCSNKRICAKKQIEEWNQQSE